MTETYMPDQKYTGLTKALLHAAPCPYTGVVTADQIKTVLGEAGIWPASVRPHRSPMVISLLTLCAVVLSGCAIESAYRAPEVDMRGVDAQKYAEDLADCTQKKRDAGFITIGGTISSCLTQRGYNVTMPYS